MSKIVQWSGDVYLCSECGTVFNKAGLECPTCKLRDSVDEQIALAVAAVSIDVEEEDYIDLDKEK